MSVGEDVSDVIEAEASFDSAKLCQISAEAFPEGVELFLGVSVMGVGVG
jgi:hypothetical protein